MSRKNTRPERTPVAIRTTIATLVPGGQGITTLEDGKKAFLWNALPGETVTEFIITKNKSHYLEGIATQIADPSPHRIAPIDPCYLSTSPWQIMDEDYELQMKSSILAETFRQANLDPQLTTKPVQTDGNFYHYRNKMEYALYFNHDDQQIHLAFHQRGSHRKFPITQSSLEYPEIFAKATEIVAKLNARHEEARKYQSLLLRSNRSGRVEGGLLENHQPHPVFNPLKDTILNYEYSYSPNGFFQINLPVYELALEAIAPHITTDHVLDLYAGVGTIGLSVARDRHLTLVETNPSAYSELEENCRNATFSGAVRKSSITAVFSKSEEALDHLTPDQTVILDPPRAGCDPTLITKLIEVTPPTIIYLSCNPATQARDLSLLTKSGKYAIIDTIPFNFFPRTPHLENLVILQAEGRHA